jgi:hypothetical protein
VKINKHKVRCVCKYIILIEFIVLTFFLLSALFSGSDSSSRVKNSLDPKLNLQNYKLLVAEIEKNRNKLAELYTESTTVDKKKRVIKKARTFIANAMACELSSYWYGTPWNFHGTTEAPQQGNIACGYFVSTILRDAGLSVERVSLAQQASENIIKSLTDEKYIKRFSNTSIENFVNYVKILGIGIYIVGLDIHTGFLFNNGENVYFIHASYFPPKCVVWEEALRSSILKASKYRVIGYISADDSLIKKWLFNSKIHTYK